MNRPTKKRSPKLSNTSKVLMTTLSLGTFIGGWNIIARLEGKNGDTAAAPPVTPTSTAARISINPTPWSTIEPLPSLPPIPKVAPLSEKRIAALSQTSAFTDIQKAILEPITPATLPEPVPIPTIAPQPTQPPAPAPLPAAPEPISDTPAPTVTDGTIGLLAPLNGSTNGLTIFEWTWNGAIPQDTGFEIMVWRNGEPPAGAHDAIADNQNGRIESLGGGRYRLAIDISGAWGVQGRGGDYLWTVSLVQINPSYAGLGIQAPPASIRFDVGGGGGGGNSNNGGGGGGGHPSTGS